MGQTFHLPLKRAQAAGTLPSTDAMHSEATGASASEEHTHTVSEPMEDLDHSHDPAQADETHPAPVDPRIKAIRANAYADECQQ